MKIKLITEVKKITDKEMKALHRVCGYEYYEVSYYLMQMILLNKLDCSHPQPMTDMQLLMHVTIGKVFKLDQDNNIMGKQRR